MFIFQLLNRLTIAYQLQKYPNLSRKRNVIYLHWNYILLAASRLAPAASGKHACGRWECTYRGALRPKGNRPAASGQWACTLGASCSKGNRPVASWQVHKRFAPKRKSACGRWACTRALHTHTHMHIHTSTNTQMRSTRIIT